ncbi:MAG TPA: PTS sugar transporter subunit IIA [Candidatus Omnitrophota bacterium]|nr:PTS sugar transporter subunit IIA [Candidatus Omnitrophota bacterium]HQO38148.1 PTS sugar transporter subunit IIA [Candidatus Omnitrophota bacterium]
MVTADLARLNSVSADLHSSTKEGVFSEILGTLSACARVGDTQRILRSLLDREQQGSTGIGSGVAVPHARLEGLTEPVLFVGVSRQGIDFASSDRQPVHIVILLLTPVSEIGASLKILAHIARMVNDRYFISRIMQASTNEELFALLKESGSAMETPALDDSRGYSK